MKKYVGNTQLVRGLVALGPAVEVVLLLCAGAGEPTPTDRARISELLALAIERTTDSGVKAGLRAVNKVKGTLSDAAATAATAVAVTAVAAAVAATVAPAAVAPAAVAPAATVRQR